MKPALAALILLPLAACATRGPGTHVCPTIHEYSDTQEKAITQALQALPRNSPLLGAMEDYEDMRDDVRACRGIAGP